MTGRALRAAARVARLRPGGGAGATKSAPEQPVAPPGPADRLAASPFFDHDHYNTVSGGSRTRLSAARHYSRRGHARGFSPHPLFDAAHVAQQLGGAGAGHGAVDPVRMFLDLQDGSLPRAVAPHPLFDAPLYVAEHPEALDHPAGVFGHYVQTGAAAGHRPNAWYQPDDGLPFLDWLREQARAWADRQQLVPPAHREWPPDAVRGPCGTPAAPASPGDGEVPVELDVVLVVDGVDPARLALSVESLRAQSLRSWALLVVHHDPLPPGLEESLPTPPAGGPARVVRSSGPGGARLANLGLALASAPLVAWLVDGDQWAPEHLHACRDAFSEDDPVAVHDDVELRLLPAAPRFDDPSTRSSRWSAADLTPAALAAGASTRLSAVVVRRTAAMAVEGFDETLPAAWDHDLLLRLGRTTGVRRVRRVGTLSWRPPERTGPAARRPRDAARFTYGELDTWRDVVLNRHAIDWESLRSRERVPGGVSVLVPTHDDADMTATAVGRVVEALADSPRWVEVVVVDNGTPLVLATRLAALPLQHPGARVSVRHLALNHGFALGNNLGLAQARGEFVVLLNNDTEVQRGWLEPLVEAFDDPDVRGAQSLLLYPTGAVQSAGVAFPTSGGVPHAFLQGFALDDAVRALPGARLAALTAAAVALRASELVDVQGLDPLFRNGMEDVDLGLRLLEARGGHFVVRPESRVIHHESRATGRYRKSLQNRRLYLERWGASAPKDDAVLWGRVGFDVVGHVVPRVMETDSRTSAPEPVLSRRLDVTEPVPRLRWALKNPAPSTPEAEVWGDTHFARALASALRRQGQDVVIDHRPEFNRVSGRHDDVALVLRGIAPEFLPVHGQLSMVWLISHPDMFPRAEAELFDVVLAASTAWARDTGARWGLPVVPLLQATDPSSFHPDAAVPDTGHPVLFVGNSRRQLRRLVSMAVDVNLPLSVYGPGWDGLIPDRFQKGANVPNAELAAAYRSAGVVLNDHWEDMRSAGFISNRLFDAVACGARVVTDDVVDLPAEDFGRSVQVARGPEDLRRLLEAAPDSVFGDDAERREVAARVAERHSFDQRARTLVDIAARRWRDLDTSRTSTARNGGPT